MSIVKRRDFVWGALIGGAFLARTALDWFAPTQDFSVRSAVSSYVGISLLLAAGFWSAWRSGSSTAGALSAIFAAVIGALISLAGAASMLAIFHDRQTLAAIDGSGGLAEIFTLPIMLVIPALIFGTLGGALGAAASAKLRIDPV